jgi:hypothetical protein
MPELPNGLNWNRLAQEMTGNIRVGLAAGEAIALFDKPAPAGHRLGWNAALVVLGATAVFAIAFWTSLPPQQAEHLLASLSASAPNESGLCIRSAAATPEEAVVLEASSSRIQVKENGRTLSLMPALGRSHGFGQHARLGGRPLRGCRYRPGDHQQGVLCGAVALLAHPRWRWCR